MRVFLSVLILIFSLQSWAKADDIRDFEIDGISIGDSILNFISEDVSIRELDYYYTNSISRASKTMSECRQIRQKIKKDGTNN